MEGLLRFRLVKLSYRLDSLRCSARGCSPLALAAGRRRGTGDDPMKPPVIHSLGRAWFKKVEMKDMNGYQWCVFK